MSQTKVLQTCLTQDEKNAAISQAKKRGLSVSAYIRRLIKADISSAK